VLSTPAMPSTAPAAWGAAEPSAPYISCWGRGSAAAAAAAAGGGAQQGCKHVNVGQRHIRGYIIDTPATCTALFVWVVGGLCVGGHAVWVVLDPVAATLRGVSAAGGLCSPCGPCEPKALQWQHAHYS